VTAAVQTQDSKEHVQATPVLPSKALSFESSSVTRDASSKTPKTPTMTPHTLTDIALKKSELLLAELAGLGLTSEGDDKAEVARGEREPEPEDGQSSGKDDAFCLDTTPTSSSALARCGQKHIDTVEVPVVLLDLLSEITSEYQSLVTAPQNKAKPESDLSSAKIKLADTVSSGASTTDDSTGGSCVCSLGGSLTAPAASRSSCSRSGPGSVSRSLPLHGTSTFKSYGYVQPPSPSMRGQSLNSTGRFGVNPSIAHTNIQLYQPQVQMQAPVAAPVRLEIPHGCRSCSIQQTFTVTSTVHLSFSVDV
jgi:hypothetical protein